MDEDRAEDWRELCKKAANELDPAKLMALIAELTRALDERDKKRNSAQEKAEDEAPGERSLLRLLSGG